MTIAVGYVRVSSEQQLDNWSIDAQRREVEAYCSQKGWTLGRLYREEGASARSDSLEKRPELKRLLADGKAGAFDVVIVHSLDRWSRNLRVTLDTFKFLADQRIAFASITESIDYATPEGRLFIAMVGAFAQYYSDSLSKHTTKGMRERVLQGLHAGPVPFGYEVCHCHEAGIHPHPTEGPAARELFQRYAAGGTTLAGLAAWLNREGFRTRNTKALPGPDGAKLKGPRLFTTSSVRNILHNPFFLGRLGYRGSLVDGRHDALVTESVFETVGIQLRRNSGRSKTISPGSSRTYLMKGLARCAHCGMPLWSEALKNGHQYYREQRGSRSYGDCVSRGRSLPAEVADGQLDRLISSLTLEGPWQQYLITRLATANERQRIADERAQTEARLKRLGRAYVDELIEEGDYQRQVLELRTRLDTMVIPEAAEALRAGEVVLSLGEIWPRASLDERHRLLRLMLDGVYLDLTTERRVVGIAPKPSFRRLFEVVTASAGSGVRILLPADFESRPGNNPGKEVVMVETGGS